MDKLTFRTVYTEMKEKPGITFTEPSRTQQEFRDECDINVILERYAATGILDHTSAYQPVFADVTAYDGDFQQAFAVVQRAEEAFMALPSALRAELDNDPSRLVAFIKNPANKDRCIEYGIFNKPEAVVADPVVVTPKEGA